MIRRILFAADMSAYAPVVLGHAQEVALKFSATIDVIHVVEPVGVFAQAILDTYLTTDILSQLRENDFQCITQSLRCKLVDNFRSEFEDEQCLGNIVVKVGNPADVILDYIKMHSIDLVVIGSSTHNMNGGYGAITQRIMQLGRTPIMVIP